MVLTKQPGREDRRQLKYWLWKSYFSASREPNYRHLDHKLIVEPILGGKIGKLDDVKIMCFHGEPRIIQIDRGRFRNHRRDFYDIKGNHLPVSLKYDNAGAPFAYHDQLDRLLDLSRQLCRNFTFMRADFYVDGDAIYVGELTSFPSNCVHGFRPAQADLEIAKLLDDPRHELSTEKLVSIVH